MGNVFTKVRFSRCREIMSSREAAMIHLGNKEFVAGEPVIINYFEDTNASVNTIMAVGIKNGKGSDCYRIITLGQYEIVWGVGRQLPDVSSLVHDELYLYQDNDDVWYYVSAQDGVRILEPLLPYPHTFINIANNTIYVSDSDRHVRSINDVYTKSEIDALLESISGGDFTSLSALERRLNEAYLRINEVIEQNAHLAETIEGISDSLGVIQEFGDKIDDFESRVSALEVSDTDGSVSGTFSSIQITEGGSSDTIVIDSSTVVTTENIEYYIGDVAEAIPTEQIEALD
jgi:hypothetical protein